VAYLREALVVASSVRIAAGAEFDAARRDMVRDLRRPAASIRTTLGPASANRLLLENDLAHRAVPRAVVALRLPGPDEGLFTSPA
jgi:hypothetical protein